MDHPKKTYHHGDLRNALVESAVQLVAEGAGDSFSLRQAARAVGVSASAAYRHFKDKSALLTAVAECGFERLSARMQKATSAAQAGDEAASQAVARFKALGHTYVDFALQNPSLFRVMFSPNGISCIIGTTPAGKAKGAAPRPHELLADALDALVVEGLLPAAQRPDAELKAWTVVHGFTSLVLDGAVSFPASDARAEALTSLLEFVVAGLCGTAG